MNNEKNKLEEYLKVGIIQTNVNPSLAWGIPPDSLNMKKHVEENAWNEIKKGFCNLNNTLEKPHLIVLPELTIPHGYVKDLKNLCGALGAVVIGGTDFDEVETGKVRNKAIMIIPEDWSDIHKARNRVSTVYFRKTFFSNAEKKMFKSLTLIEFPDPICYILDAGRFGEVGVAICADFFDLERFVLYRGQIHHMIIIALNRDTDSFFFLAEAISRLVYCNVIICNSGHYGDSLVFSPYNDSYRRFIYRHKGQNLFATQMVNLPVLDLDKAQRGDDKRKKFKSPPPGYYRKR